METAPLVEKKTEKMDICQYCGPALTIYVHVCKDGEPVGFLGAPRRMIHSLANQNASGIIIITWAGDWEEIEKLILKTYRREIYTEPEKDF
jgi:hypothetical protein